jgi:hypothetical protein
VNRKLQDKGQSFPSFCKCCGEIIWEWKLVDNIHVCAYCNNPNTLQELQENWSFGYGDGTGKEWRNDKRILQVQYEEKLAYEKELNNYIHYERT